MHECVCIYASVCICVHVSIYDHMSLCLRVSMYTSVCALAFVSVCSCLCAVYVRICVREPVCVLVSACVHTCEFFVRSLGQSRGTQRFEQRAGEVDAKTGLV